MTAGHTHTGINAVLTSAGAIAGKISKKGSSTGVNPVAVYAFNSHKIIVATGSTASNGTYRITGLIPGKYYVCVLQSSTPASGAPYGFVPQCRGTSTPANGFTVPSGAVTSTVASAHATTVNLALPLAGAIGGKFASSSGKSLSGGYAAAYRGGKIVATGSASAGKYTITGLPAGTGYRVCFSGPGATGGTSKTGYLSECWSNVIWSGGTVPSHAKAVSVRAGKLTKNVNASLAAGGAIAGTIRASATGHKPVVSSYVVAYLGSVLAGSGSSQGNGAYKILGLRAGSSYKVCATGGETSGSSNSYGARCYTSVAWAGAAPPKSAKTVSVKAGKTHSGINLQLPAKVVKTGSIAGKVTVTGGAPAEFASVLVYRGTSEVSSGSTSTNGTYTVSGLTPGTSYTVCFRGAYAFSSTTSDTGYGNVCYHQVHWDGAMSGPPSNGNHVSVTAGHTHTGINATIGLGGAISGTIKAHTGNSGLSTSVVVLNSRHQIVGNGYSSSDGTYTVKGLTPSAGYTVCFLGQYASSGNTDPYGYINQCYKQKNWYGSLTGGFGA